MATTIVYLAHEDFNPTRNYYGSHDVSDKLNERGLKTHRGMEFTPIRARTMYGTVNMFNNA